MGRGILSDLTDRSAPNSGSPSSYAEQARSLSRIRLASSVGGHCRAIAAATVAVALRPIFRQVDDSVVAVVGGTDPQPAELPSAHDIDERHCGIDRHLGGQRCLGWSGMQVVVPLIVFHKLREGIGLPQELVDKLDDSLLVQLPQSAQSGAQVPDSLQLGVVMVAFARPAPGAYEIVQ